MKCKISSCMAVFLLLLFMSSCSLPSGLPYLTPTEAPLPTLTVIEMAPTATSPIDVADAMVLTDITHHDESEEYHFAIDAVYPQLENGGVHSSIFNQLVEDRLFTDVNQFKDTVSEDDFSLPDSVVGTFYNQGYSVYWFNEQFISMLFYVTVYYGGVHPGMHHFVINYDVQTQDEVHFSELFYPNSGILVALQDYCTTELNSRFPEGFFEDGLTPKLTNYGNWNLSEEGLVLTFEEYQVNAYAYGPQTVVVPYSSLESYIDPDGPLGTLIDQQLEDSTD